MTEDQVGALLKELCLELGFCLPSDGYDRIADHPPETADAFARAVFAAEGLDYDGDPREGLKAAVREMAARHLDAAR